MSTDRFCLVWTPGRLVQSPWLLHMKALLIIDERKGRSRAKSLGIVITGLIGILIRAKQRGLISSGKDKLDSLRKQGFHLSDKIYQLALRETK
ncbi:DUF3368 domain-containing protein [Lewinella sp. JB7]|uniref:DUF3368 domain-containing protein n=1 Tax=Lewinella sp. JB7 TaxID=2962887 RepID=UPI003531DA28